MLINAVNKTLKNLENKHINKIAKKAVEIINKK